MGRFLQAQNFEQYAELVGEIFKFITEDEVGELTKWKTLCNDFLSSKKNSSKAKKIRAEIEQENDVTKFYSILKTISTCKNTKLAQRERRDSMKRKSRDHASTPNKEEKKLRLSRSALTGEDELSQNDGKIETSLNSTVGQNSKQDETTNKKIEEKLNVSQESMVNY